MIHKLVKRIKISSTINYFSKEKEKALFLKISVYLQPLKKYCGVEQR
jgi:hypothetical protein